MNAAKIQKSGWLQRAVARVVCWAFAVRQVEVLLVDDREAFLVITLPWYISHLRAVEFTSDISARTGLSVIALPHGSTIAKLRRAGRMTDPAAEAEAGEV